MKIVLLGGAAVFVGLLAVRAAAVASLITKNPIAAARFAPDDPRVAMALAMLEFRRDGGVVRPGTQAAALAAARKAPLAEEPFLLGGVAALVRGDERRGTALLTEARRRNPRSRASRLLLLDRYLRSGRVAQAAVESAALSRLLPTARQPLVAEMAKFAKNPATVDALAGVLRSDESLREDVLAELAKDTRNADLILRLVSRSGAVRPGQIRPWQAELVNNFVVNRQVGRAYGLWRQFSGASVASGPRSVYDSGFRGAPGSPPFNWQYHATAAGVAEKNRGPGMQVEYYGRQPAVLATQLLMLPPGAHRLVVRAEGDAPGEASRLAWKAECLESQAEIADLPLLGVTYSPRVLTRDFTVPGLNCSAQWLRLIGVPDEFPEPQSALVTDVRIDRRERS